MNTLFVYGTLLIEEIMYRVSGKKFRGRTAVLRDHIRFRVNNASYPGIIYSKGSLVEGTVYFDIDDLSLQRIDAFESDLYERISADIISDRGESLTAYVYRIKEGYSHLLTDEPWDVAQFMSRGLASFLEEMDTAAEWDITPDRRGPQ